MVAGVYGSENWKFSPEKIRSLNIMDEFNREDLKIKIDDKSIISDIVVRTLNQIMVWRGAHNAKHLYNGSEFIADYI
jgi:hypothetical protein